MKLSIGKAWDETRAIVARDGNPLIAIALALLVLPGAIVETVAPSALRTTDTPLWVSTIGLFALLVSLTGQIAVSRIALGPSTTVRAAIATGFRRLPALFVALLVFALPFLAVLVVLLGGDPDPAKIPLGMSIAALVVMLAFLYVLVRMLFLTPLAADRTESPVALLRSSWALTRGKAGKLFVLVLLLALVALLLVGGLAGALSAAVILLLGPVEPGNVSALLVALIQQIIGATVSLFFAIVVARLYLQARDGAVTVSVPDAGHD